MMLFIGYIGMMFITFCGLMIFNYKDYLKNDVEVAFNCFFTSMLWPLVWVAVIFVFGISVGGFVFMQPFFLYEKFKGNKK